MASDLDPSTAADAGEPPEVRELLTSAGIDVVNRDDLPMFNPASIAAALVDRTGKVVCASPAFAAIAGERHLDPAQLARAGCGAPAEAISVELATEDGVADTAVHAYALASQALSWRLPPEVREAAGRRPRDVVVLTTQSIRAGKPLEEACRAYGLSGLETRVALATIRTGNAKTAAAQLGIGYHTARRALADAMKRTQAPRLPALVAQLTSLAFGVLPKAGGGEVLQDLWGLTPRQAAIAGLVAEGLSRAEAAGALGLSEAVVKKELDRVYLVMQATTGAQLARKLVEAQALRWLTRATGGDIGFLDPVGEPLQFAHRPDGSRIAFSDYGPASGKPVLVVHSSTTSRPVARGLLRALQAAGYRPLAIDRPGFGLTDEVPGSRAGAHDHWAAAAEDAVRILDRLKLGRIDLVARGGAKFVLALEAAAPGRLGRVVLVNPDPHVGGADRGFGIFGRLKQAARRNPSLIRFSIALMVRQVSYERLADFLRRSLRGSPPDELALQDPELVRDYFRAFRTVATGRHAGAVNEQVDFAEGRPPARLAGTTNWRVLVAAHDTMHDPEQVLAVWRSVLPDARFRTVEDAGRLLALSHPHYVVAALTEA